MPDYLPPSSPPIADQWSSTSPVRENPYTFDASSSPAPPSPPSKASSFRRKPLPIAKDTDAQIQRNSASSSMKRKPLNTMSQPEVRIQQTAVNPVSISPPRTGIQQPAAASIREARSYETADDWGNRRSFSVPESRQLVDSLQSLSLDFNGRPEKSAVQALRDQSQSRASSSSRGDVTIDEEAEYVGEPQEGLQYHAFDNGSRKQSPQRMSHLPSHSIGSGSAGGGDQRSTSLHVPRTDLSRPASAYTLGSESRGRTLSPLSAEESPHSRSREASGRRSPASRPHSYLDLLSNVPYHQQIAPAPMNNTSLQSAVGSAASLLDTKKTLDMYRANVKKTNDASVQYEFAIFMVNASRDVVPGDGIDPAELITEAKHILQRLSDRSYPFAQYYLGDGYFSGLFSKDKTDFDKAFMLFLAASKHGHAEAGYRAALCYEFGWGTTKSYVKAVNFYRTSASKNHPGAATRLGLACIKGDMGLGRDKYREGVKWLKRATESADAQYNAAPYELGMLHLTGFGGDIFKDEAYAAQLFTQSAELGHLDANYMLGRAYENGLYGCPRDAALSVHFYNGAAARGHAEAMMALCAWYMVGAEPVLGKDEGEAYAWARQAAETGFPKAQYAVGYFTEMGIGCRRDPLEANVWYVRAADQGNATARQRLEIIRAAASSSPGVPMSKAEPRTRELGGAGGAGRGGFSSMPSSPAGKEGRKKKLGLF